MLLYLVGALLALSVLSYILFDKDLFAPPTVICVVLLFGAVCTLYNAKRWGLDFSSESTWIIISGVSFFIVGGLIAIILYNIRHPSKCGFSHTISEAKQITIEKYKIWLVILFELVTIVALYKQLRLFMGNELSWSEVVHEYRDQMNLEPEEVTMRLPFLLGQCLSLWFALAFFFTYVLANNLASKAKNPWLSAVPVVLYLVLSFMQGYRGDLIRIWIAFLVCYYTVKKREAGWKRTRETQKIIWIIGITILIIGLLFVLLRKSVGRTDGSKDWDPLYYVTFYAGSPIAAFDLFVKDHGPRPAVWAKETFYYLNQSIGAWFNIPKLRYSFPKEFRVSPNGTWIGNIYTAFRAPYNDFGLIGMIVFSLLIGIFFTLLYCLSRKPQGKRAVDLYLLAYSYVVYTCFLFFYNNYFFFLSTAFIKTLLFWIIARWFFTDFHITRFGSLPDWCEGNGGIDIDNEYKA